MSFITGIPRKRLVTERRFALSLAKWSADRMENRYWIGRKRFAMAMAREAATAEIRLIHYDLAGRYSIMAAQCRPDPAAARPVLHLAPPQSHPLMPLGLRGEGKRS